MYSKGIDSFLSTQEFTQKESIPFLSTCILECTLESVLKYWVLYKSAFKYASIIPLISHIKKLVNSIFRRIRTTVTCSTYIYIHMYSFDMTSISLTHRCVCLFCVKKPPSYTALNYDYEATLTPTQFYCQQPPSTPVSEISQNLCTRVVYYWVDFLNHNPGTHI